MTRRKWIFIPAAGAGPSNYTGWSFVAQKDVNPTWFTNQSDSGSAQSDSQSGSDSGSSEPADNLIIQYQLDFSGPMDISLDFNASGSLYVSDNSNLVKVFYSIGVTGGTGSDTGTPDIFSTVGSHSWSQSWSSHAISITNGAGGLIILNVSIDSTGAPDDGEITSLDFDVDFSFTEV